MGEKNIWLIRVGCVCVGGGAESSYSMYFLIDIARKIKFMTPPPTPTEPNKFSDTPPSRSEISKYGKNGHL